MQYCLRLASTNVTLDHRVNTLQNKTKQVRKNEKKKSVYSAKRELV